MKFFRRFSAWLGELTLVQQLLTLVMLSVIIFYLTFFVHLRTNIANIAEQRTYVTLQRYQDLVASEYLYNHSTIESYETATPSVSHAIYVNGKLDDFTGIYLQDEDLTPILHMYQDVLLDEPVYGHMLINQTVVYYAIKKIAKSTIILSVIDQSEITSLEALLFSSVSNVAAVVVSIIFILFFAWVVTLLHPLNQIRAYIEKIRNGEDATLNIERNDEIGDVATALVNMRKELKRQDEIKEEMIHNISHDLKTPIATIKSYGESIKDGIYPYKTLEASVDVIIENANRLEQKVHSLLFLNRLDYMLSQQEMDMKDINMKELIEHVLLSLRVIRPEIQITADLQPVIFRGEEESWRVLVENLVDNGLRYAKTNVHLQLSEGCLRVSNDGSSISEDRMDKLFKPFEKGTKGKFGLGLNICYKVANAYGYSISASNLEEGVMFTVKDKTIKKDPKKNQKRQDIRYKRTKKTK